jgi:pimeloyl-ACP methyl ester carboxylesterase
MVTLKRNRLRLARLALIVAVSCLLCYAALRTRTPPIRSRSASIQPVATLEQVTLGGDQQWILIRGADRRAPIVLFLHGGPGMPMMYLAYKFQRPLEQKFLVVQWDRRGAGKSYSSKTDPRKMRTSQEVADGIELIEYLRNRFGQRQIILVGHSYGTTLGMLLAKARPDLLRAYVGVGQDACDRKTEQHIQDQWIATEAHQNGNQALADRALSGTPYDTESALFKYGGEIANSHSVNDLIAIGVRAPEYSIPDVVRVKLGVDFTHKYFKNDVFEGSLMDFVPRLEVPTYFFEGRRDYTSPSVCAARYFEQLSAPRKTLVWFDHSAHFPFLEEPGAFATALERVASETSDQSSPVN